MVSLGVRFIGKSTKGGRDGGNFTAGSLRRRDERERKLDSCLGEDIDPPSRFDYGIIPLTQETGA